LAHFETIFFDNGIDGSLHRPALAPAGTNYTAHLTCDAPVLQAFRSPAFAAKA
jgi:hypothetical protein